MSRSGPRRESIGVSFSGARRSVSTDSASHLLDVMTYRARVDSCCVLRCFLLFANSQTCAPVSRSDDALAIYRAIRRADAHAASYAFFSQPISSLSTPPAPAAFSIRTRWLTIELKLPEASRRAVVF